MSTLALTVTTADVSVSTTQLVGVDTITVASNTVPRIVRLPFVAQPQAILVTNNGSAPVVLLLNSDSVGIAAGASRVVLLSGNDLGPSIVDTSVNVGTDVAWADITGKPTTFAPIIGTGATDAKAGNYTPPNAGAATRGLVLQAPTQAASVAVDVATLVTDFNALLAKLKTAGMVA